jgi:hypothetical protein
MYSTVFNRVKDSDKWEVRHFSESDEFWCCYCGCDDHDSEQCHTGLETINSKQVTYNVLFDLEYDGHDVVFYNNSTGKITSMKGVDSRE